MNEITTRHSFRCDLNAGTLEVTLDAPLMHQDALGDVFSVSVWRSGSPVELDDVTVRGYLYLAATQQTVLLDGSVSGSSAAVTLDSSCYAVPSHASLVIQLQKGTVRHTVLKVNFVIDRTCTDTVIDPSNVLPTLPELLAQIAAMEQGTAAANAAAEAANTAAANAQELIVTVTMPEFILNGDMSVIKSDKTFAEIRAAITAGKTPVVKLVRKNHAETTILYMDFFAPVSIVFREHTSAPNDYNVGSGMQITFLSTGGITLSSATFRSVPDGGEDGQVLVHKGESTYEWRDSNKLSVVSTLAPAIIPTATGSIVSITDGAARPAVEVISHIEPVQSGSGEASPNNKRPISGWDSVSAWLAGRNLASDSYTDYMVGDNYATYMVNPTGRIITMILTEKDSNVDVNECYIGLCDDPNNLIDANSYVWALTGGILVSSAIRGVSFKNIFIYPNTESAFNKIFARYNIQVVFGSTETAYESYKETKSLTATLPETVYGGMKNWTTGVLTPEYGLYEFPEGVDDVYTVQDVPGRGTGKIITVWPDGIVNAGDNLLTGTFVAEAFVDSGITDLAYLNDSIKVWQAYHTSGAIGICVPADSTSESVREILAGTKIAYKLATPQEIQLTPQQLDTLKGTNNVWSNTGETTLSYVADTKLYIDQKLAAIAAATLNK